MLVLFLTVLCVSCACAETIVKFYMTEFKRDISTAIQVVDFTPLDSLGKPIILWNRTDPQSSDERRGKVENNVWKISNLTQADNGYYNFKLRRNVVESRIQLLVKENTFHYDLKEDESFIITYPQFGKSWTVIFKPKNGEDQETVMKGGSLVLKFHRFTQKINIKGNGIEIEKVELKDSGTFEFRDSQGNLAMAVHLNVSAERNDAIVTYIAACIGAVFVGICCCGCCCWCKRNCCKKDSAAPQTEAAAPAVYYHDTVPQTVPSYSVPSVYPQQPGYQPVNIYPPPSGTDVNPPQPGTNIYPPPSGTNIYPPPSGTNIYPPPSGTNIYPLQPATDMKPPQTEVGPPTAQGPPTAPTFNSEFLSSDTEPTFVLKGFSSSNPLSSATPSYDVHNLDKLNFL